MEVNEIRIELEKGLFGPMEKSNAKAISFLLELISELDTKITDLTAENKRLRERLRVHGDIQTDEEEADHE